jgi:hypothetical protein
MFVYYYGSAVFLRSLVNVWRCGWLFFVMGS